MMFWKKKTPLELLIHAYGKDTHTLLEFSKTINKPRIEEITLDDIKSYYTSVVEPQNSVYRRLEMMKAVRKFFKEHRSKNVLRWQEILDNPLNLVENIAIVQYMPKEKEKKRGPGRPRDIVNIKRAIAMRKEGIPYRTIAVALKKDVSQIFVWIRDQELLLS